MSLNKTKSIITSLFTATLLFTGCGSGSNTSSTVPSKSITTTGKFIDDPVIGLAYECESNVSGITNDAGEYTCPTGEDVTFFLGSATIGTLSAQSGLITPYSFFPNDNDAALNLARLLQTVDDNSVSGKLKLDTILKAKIPANTDFSDANFTSAIESTLGRELIDETIASASMNESIVEYGGSVASDDNYIPIANAGEDILVTAGDVVNLDGSRSSDADKETLTYKWNITLKPSDSNAILSDATSVTPSFIADKDGHYVVELVVNDGTSDSSADSIRVHTNITEYNKLYHSVTTGNSDDMLTITRKIAKDAIVDTGDGEDTLNIKRIKTATLLTGAGDDTVTIERVDPGKAKINTGSGDDNVTLDNVSSGYDHGEFTLGTGDDSLTIEDTLSGTKTIFDGGDGNDTLTLSNVTRKYWDRGVKYQFVNFENIRLKDNEKVITDFNGDDSITLKRLVKNTLNTSSGNDELYVQKLRNSNLQTGEGKDTLIIDRVDPGSATIDTGDGDDTLTLVNVSGDYDDGSVNLGDGNDTLTINDSLSGTKSTFDGGAGYDTLILTNVTRKKWDAGIKDLFSNFENIRLKDNERVITNFSGDDTFNVEKLRNSELNTSTGDDTIIVERVDPGSATIDTGDGDDTLTLVNVSGDYDDGSVNLGDGNDTLTINDSLSGTKSTFDGGAGYDTLILTNVTRKKWDAGIKDLFSNFENIRLKDNERVITITTISGYVEDDALVNATVTLKDSNNTELVNTTTDGNGFYTLDAHLENDKTYTITADGQLDDKNITMSTLFKFTDLNKNININPITDLKQQLVKNNAKSIEEAEALIREYFYILNGKKLYNNRFDVDSQLYENMKNLAQHLNAVLPISVVTQIAEEISRNATLENKDYSFREMLKNSLQLEVSSENVLLSENATVALLNLNSLNDKYDVIWSGLPDNSVGADLTKTFTINDTPQDVVIEVSILNNETNSTVISASTTINFYKKETPQVIDLNNSDKNVSVGNDVQLFIPQDAVTSTPQIIYTEITTNRSDNVKTFILEPSGTVFTTPIQIRVKYNSAIVSDPRQLQIKRIEDDGTEAILKIKDINYATDELTFETDHFSTFMIRVVTSLNSSQNTLFPGHTLGGWSNPNAFAVLKEDGSVVTWGDENSGGDSSSVSASLQNVKAIYSNENAFAALKEDGTVVTWGDEYGGGDSSEVTTSSLGSDSPSLENVKRIYSTNAAFAALKEDGSVVTWGDRSHGGDSRWMRNNSLQNVKNIYSTYGGFAALKEDKTVVTWGAYDWNFSSISSSLQNVKTIYSTAFAFAALKEDGSVVTWGGAGGDSSRAGSYLQSGGDSSSVSSSLQNVKTIYSTWSSFAALKYDGTVVTWGNAAFGGDSSSVSSSLQNVKAIYSTRNSFAALKEDGTVVTWGDQGRSDISRISNLLQNIKTISSTDEAFAALKEDGTVVSWRGDEIQCKSRLLQNVKIIYSNGNAFAALKEDGTVVTWNQYRAGIPRISSPFTGVKSISQSYIYLSE